jgi:hypothetical protein
LLSELDLWFLWWLLIRSIQITIYGIYLKTIPSHKKLKWKVFISNYFGDRFRVDAENLGLPLSFGLRVSLLVDFECCSRASRAQTSSLSLVAAVLRATHIVWTDSILVRTCARDFPMIPETRTPMRISRFGAKI